MGADDGLLPAALISIYPVIFQL